MMLGFNAQADFDVCSQSAFAYFTIFMLFHAIGAVPDIFHYDICTDSPDTASARLH